MAEPRDHILALGVQLRSDMTTLANVTAKVRVNGGAATTYTNVSSPAITQNGDITYGYQLKLAANTFADGDDIEVTWLYSGTAYAYATYVIGPAAVDGAHYTTARGDNLDGLDAAVSTRLATSGYTAPDNADITAIKAKTDNLPADPASEASVESAISSTEATLAGLIAAIPAAVWNALTSGLTAAGSIGKLLATNIDAKISGASRPPRAED